MRRFILIAIAALSLARDVSAAPAAVPRGVTVSVDTNASKAVLDAVLNPGLTMAEAMKIAALPGNQGLIRKARSYGRPGTFRFASVREHAAQIQATLAKLDDPAARLLAGVKARIADFTPSSAAGHVSGYLIVGGTSGGFAFGEPEFFLNLDRFPSAALATTIMQHELFHAVQAIAATARKPSMDEQACVAGIPQRSQLSKLFGSLEMEGSASLVGDVAAMPPGVDGESDEARRKALRNIDLVGRSITLLELSVHGLETGAQVGYDDIYALGFYGDEVLYALGYVMARAIAAEEGKGAIAALSGQPGALFVQRYSKLKGYGKSDSMPALHARTLRSAEQLAACVKEGAGAR